MACQNCTATCNCQLSEDGYEAFRSQDGRHNITVSGNGTGENPFVLEFQQSEFYRPPAGELSISTSRVFISGADERVDPSQDSVVTIYESPNDFFLFIPTASTDAVTFVNNTFHVVGASLTFVAQSSGIRFMRIKSPHPLNGSDVYVAGNSQGGRATSPTTLTCAGYSPGFMPGPSTPIPALLSDISIDGWGIGFWQTSGSPLTVTKIKFWAVTL